VASLVSKEGLKRRLVQVGARTSARTLGHLNACLNYLEAGHWMRSHGYRLDNPDVDRYALFRRAASDIADDDVLYLEFGVSFGDAFRFWSQLLHNPNSKLHGFDSFEGLPTAWKLGGGLSTGDWSTDGQIPAVDDQRATFFKGWFAETLPDYEWPPHETLVVNIDADLYSSTVTALDAIEPHLRPGSLLYFDEFSYRADELRAFDEFLERTGMTFELVGATPLRLNVMFRRT
jgi:hypothetical protein